jgi:hypothetical protein
MGRYKVEVVVKMIECPDSEEPETAEPRQRRDGGFEMVISQENAINIDICEQAMLLPSYKAIRHEISRHLTELSKKKAQEQAGGREVIESAQPYHVDGEVGRFQFGTHTVAKGKSTFVDTSVLFPPLRNGKEMYRTSGFKEVALLLGCVDKSYRKTADLVNRIRRQREDGTPSRTLRENAAEEGGKVLDFMEKKATKVFKEKGFSPEGRPSEETVELEQGRRIETLPEEVVAQAMEKVKAEGARQGVDVQKWGGVVREDPDRTVNVSLDGVTVKSQKSSRGQPRAKDEPQRIEDIVAHVRHGGNRYVLVGRSVAETIRLVLALLINSGLLTKTIAFFVDGQRTLQIGIQSSLSWKGNIFIILDWRHLEKKCKELLSMAMKGRQVRNGVLKRLSALLWYGQVEQAIACLKSLDGKEVRNFDEIEKLAGYFIRNKENIPNYALRKELGLQNSSNRVEKANGQVVAGRQKHNGMSWSQHGSISQAGLKAVVLNKETRNWLHHGEIVLKLAS